MTRLNKNCGEVAAFTKSMRKNFVNVVFFVGYGDLMIRKY